MLQQCLEALQSVTLAKANLEFPYDLDEVVAEAIAPEDGHTFEMAQEL